MNTKPVYFFDGIDLAKVYPEWKSPLFSANFDLIQNFEALNETSKKLLEKEQALEFFDSEMKIKWAKLKRKQDDFLVVVQNYNSFFVENEEKLKRIEEKIKFEVESLENYNHEIKELENRIEYLSTIEKKLEKSLKILHPYDVVVRNIATKTKQFEKVKDFINYYILLNVETRLLKEFNENLNDSETLQSQILENLKARKWTFSNQNNTSFHLSEDFSDLKDDLEQWKNKLHDRIELNESQDRETSIIKYSCENVYTKLRKWKRIPASKHKTNEEKLAFIIGAIRDLQNAIDLCIELKVKSETSFLTDSSNLTPRRII